MGGGRATAWAVIDVLPGYPVDTVPVAVAATGRGKPAVSPAAHRLFDLLAGLDAGR